jgi:hypothetical protein
MTCHSELKRLAEIRQEITALYKEKYTLEQSLIDKMVASKEKTAELDDGTYRYTLVWVYDKKIDYERFQRLYPDVYQLGLQTTFSMNTALRAIDSGLLEAIIKDCTTVNPHYKIKGKREE